LAFAVTDAKGKLSAPIVLTGELAKLKTWLDDAIADFEETAEGRLNINPTAPFSS